MRRVTPGCDGRGQADVVGRRLDWAEVRGLARRGLAWQMRSSFESRGWVTWGCVLEEWLGDEWSGGVG